MIIREPRESEISSIAALEEQCFDAPWSYDSLKGSFDNRSDRFFVAVADGEIIGYIGLSVIIDEGYILNVAVSPAHRRRGTAKALIDYVIEKYQKSLKFLTLEVRPSNTAAIKLYEGFGFEPAGRRKNYYSNPVEDALLLTKFFN